MGTGNARRIDPPVRTSDAAARGAAVGAAPMRSAMTPELFDLDQLDVAYEIERATLWTLMNPIGRASFNRDLLADYERWQLLIVDAFDGDDAPALQYLVLGSRVPGVFCYGGDLDLFVRLIRAGDRAGLVDYGRRCVDILHRNINSLGMPIVTIGMVAGDALGGGWEALMSFDVIIAEKGTKFGLPETMFGLFPGMGAHAILARKLGQAKAEHIILSGENFSAEQLHDMGLVHILAEPGEARETVERYIDRETRRHCGRVGAFAAMKRVNPVTHEELRDIVEIWATSALRLSEKDIKLMLRLVAAQSRQADDAGGMVQATLEPSPFSGASRLSA